MIGKLKLTKKSSGGGGVNGRLETHIVATGNSVVSGDFVKIVSGTTVGRAIQGDTILGITKDSGSANSTVQVYVPNV